MAGGSLEGVAITKTLLLKGLLQESGQCQILGVKAGSAKVMQCRPLQVSSTPCWFAYLLAPSRLAPANGKGSLEEEVTGGRGKSRRVSDYKDPPPESSPARIWTVMTLLKGERGGAGQACSKLRAGSPTGAQPIAV